MKGYCLKKNIYFRSIRAKFSSSRSKFRLVNLNLVYIQLNLARCELNNKKLYVYLSHFVKFGTWNFPILMEMMLYSPKLFSVIVYILKLVNDSLSFFSSLIYAKEKFWSRLAPIIIEVWWLASMVGEFRPAFLVLARRSQISFNFNQLCPTA
jgi:hypothetical protein